MALDRILRQPTPGLQPLLLKLQPHHAAFLQAQHSISAATNQVPVLHHLLEVTANATIDQLQELLLRLLQLAAVRNSSSITAEGAAVAVHCLFHTTGPHSCYVAFVLAQPRSRELLQLACRSSSSVVQAAAAATLRRPVDDLLQPALQALSEQAVSAVLCAPARMLQLLQQHQQEVMQASNTPAGFKPCCGSCSLTHIPADNPTAVALSVANQLSSMAAAGTTAQRKLLLCMLLHYAASGRCEATTAALAAALICSRTTQQNTQWYISCLDRVLLAQPEYQWQLLEALSSSNPCTLG